MARNMTGAQRSMEQMRRWLARAYPDLDIPAILATVQGTDPRVARRAAATSNHDQRLIKLYDPSVIGFLDQLSRLPYSGNGKRGIQTGIHEILHQAGPRYGGNGNDMWIEEGLAESVAADLAPGYARTLPYRPLPAQRFEDGSWSTPNDDFRFKPDSYGPNVAAIRKISFNDAIRRMGAGWEGLEDPGDSPEAMDFRRAMLMQTVKQRRKTYARAQQRLVKERTAPNYIPRTVQSVGKTVSRAAAVPRDPIAMAAQQVGRSTRSAGRGLPANIRRKVNAVRMGL